MVMTRYEFLAQAHAILNPRTYLEIGVQTGASLALAERASFAIGIDPVAAMLPQFRRPNQITKPVTSAEFFASLDPTPGTFGAGLLSAIDFGFIDGSHLFEDALLDFINLERRMAPGGVIMFDDVLPYNEAIAAREQPPGDWTGDVWKIVEVLRGYRPALRLTLVDVAPVGVLVVTDLDPADSTLNDAYVQIVSRHVGPAPVPSEIIQRLDAVSPDAALEALRHRGELIHG